MKLIIIITLLTIASSTHMRNFLSLQAGDGTFCGSIEKATMCGCQASGCAFVVDQGVCTGVAEMPGNPNHLASTILPTCAQATTQEACENHIAWEDRYGSKTDCAWCSTACVHAHHGDDSCITNGYLQNFLDETPLPKPTTEEPVLVVHEEPIIGGSTTTPTEEPVAPVSFPEPEEPIVGGPTVLPPP